MMNTTSLFVFSLFLHLILTLSQPTASDEKVVVLDEVSGLSLKFSQLSAHVVPALYVFGDSIVDAGNNNFLPTMAKANFLPYGIDFVNGKPTGRFTDGKTSADFTALLLGLPMPPPYLGLSKSQKISTLSGVNYASGACGILPNTGSIAGTCLSLDKQIDLFQSTLQGLKGHFSSSEQFAHYLSKSVFYINIGSNDFLMNYILPGTNLSTQYPPPAFAQFLSQELSKRLQRLHGLGARKLIVNTVGAIGCIPAMLNTLKPKTPCVDQLNAMVSLYNTKLRVVLAHLQSTLPKLKYVIGDIFKVFQDVRAAPSSFGMTDARSSCCMDAAGNGTSACFPNKKPCTNIKQHVFFDPFHPTQATHFLMMKRCFYELSVCSPITLKQLLLS